MGYEKLSIEEIKKELRGATQNRKKLRLNVELSDRFYLSDAIVSLFYAKAALKASDALQDDEDKALALYKYGRALTKTSEFIDARPYLQDSLTIYRALSDKGHIATVVNIIANTYLAMGEYPKAIEQYTESLELAKEVGNEYLQTMIHGNIGIVYSRIGDFYAAFRHQSEGLEIALKIGTTDIGPSYMNLATVYWELGEREKCREYLWKALEEGKKNNDIMCEQMSTMNLAEIDVTEGLYEEALAKYITAGEIAHSQDFLAQETRIVELIGRVKSFLGEHQQALKKFEEAERLIEYHNFFPNLPSLLTAKAQTYLAINDLANAEFTITDAIPLAVKYEEKSTESTLHQLLSDCYKRLGKFEEALTEQVLYSDLQRDIFQQNQQRAMADAHTRLEIESALREREHMRREKEQLEHELTSKQQELAAVALQIAKQNETLGKLTQQFKTTSSTGDKTHQVLKEIDRIRSNDDEWKQFESQFDTIHSGFTTKLLEKYSTLTPKEVRICALMKLNLSSKDIANTLAISQRTVEVHRLQIRKKMKLKQTDNLQTRLASLA